MSLDLVKWQCVEQYLLSDKYRVKLTQKQGSEQGLIFSLIGL